MTMNRPLCSCCVNKCDDHEKDVSIHSDTSTIPQVTSPARGSDYISQETVQQLQLAMTDMENKLKEGVDERESILAAMRIKLEEQERTISEHRTKMLE